MRKKSISTVIPILRIVLANSIDVCFKGGVYHINQSQKQK